MAGLWLSGCATAPFPRPEPFAGPGSRRKGAAAFADAWRRVSNNPGAGFRFYLREIAALGYLSVDRAEGTFAMACLNPVASAVRTGRNKRQVSPGSLPEIEKYGANAQAAGQTDASTSIGCRGRRSSAGPETLDLHRRGCAGQTDNVSGRDGFWPKNPL
jgi:hypothetical protein